MVAPGDHDGEPDDPAWRGLEVGGTCYPVCTAAAIDPDGDGWGWENNASCLVAGSAPAQGAPWCDEGSSPPGLEVGGTCYPVCTAAAIDPDGDGWGWENNASCLVAGSPPAQGASPCGGDSAGGDSAGGDTTTGGGGCASDGFYVDAGRLYDDHCQEFTIRGINYPYVWYAGLDTAQQFADMASAGANTIRVVLANGGQWSRVSGAEVAQIIQWAKDNELVTMLEVHDATGWSEQGGAAHPQSAVDYWLSPDIRAAIDGNEAFVLINIANEPMGNTTTAQWAPFHQGAVAQLRAAGVGHTLVVDAPNWGQDWSGTMRNGVAAQQIFDADPDANVVFSVHMYDVYDTSAKVQAYIDDFLATGLPLIVGEFAADHGVGAPVAAGAIMAHCEANGVGYVGWSWSGNSASLASLDMVVGFSVATPTAWGQMILNGPNGLAATAQTCTCFGS